MCNMTNEKTPPIVALGDYVIKLMSAIAWEGTRPYPVLGAEGNEFFIDIAAGPFESRRILKTIRIEIHENLEQPVLPDLLSRCDELSIFLPDAALLIGLVGLLQQKLNASTQMLHPLDERGDFLPGWTQTITMISLEKFS